jgi:hypothetical protein
VSESERGLWPVRYFKQRMLFALFDATRIRSQRSSQFDELSRQLDFFQMGSQPKTQHYGFNRVENAA